MDKLSTVNCETLTQIDFCVWKFCEYLLPRAQHNARGQELQKNNFSKMKKKNNNNK